MKSILIIDDCSEWLERTKQLLENSSFNVLTANTKSEGIFMAKLTCPSLILCDFLFMSNVGFSILKELSTDDRTRFIPFIFFTGQENYEHFRKAMELGADDYLIKHREADQLIITVKQKIKKYCTICNIKKPRKSGV